MVNSTFIEYIWLVPGLPLLGAAINGVAGRWLPRKIVAAIAYLSVGLSFAVALGVFIAMLGLPVEEREIVRVLYTWIGSGAFVANVAALIDPLSAFMILVVSGVGFLIHVYSAGYMAEDPRFSRYFAYLNLFTFSMLLLVLANNFLLLFVGWELVGLCSYLLIGFWYERLEAADAGRKAFYTTRLGDVGFIVGIVLIFATFGTLDYAGVFAAAGAAAAGTLTAIGLLLLAGAIGKSAQIPLYVWLPDAMEGPTPVSALIHAATMVTAGVYLIVRCYPIYTEVPGVLLAVAVLGAVTALFSATIAAVQNDIKRVLAYSTISQIGYMFLAVGVGAFVAAMFHLMTHAFFKALLFLGAGSVMHALNGETNIQKMGGLGRKMPITKWTFLIGSLALAGIIPFSGFFSKDEILWAAFTGSVWLYVLGLLTAVITAFYIFRVYFKTFSGRPAVTEEGLHEHAHESPPVMGIPLVVLGVLAAVGGFVGIPTLGERDVNLVKQFLGPTLERAEPHHPGVGGPAGEPVLLLVTMMLLAVVVSLAAIYTAYRWYVKRPGTAANLARRAPGAYNLLLNKYYIDEAYNYLFVRPAKRMANVLYDWLDVTIIDKGAVEGSAGLVWIISDVGRRLQTGFVRNYALAIVAGAVVLVGYLMWRV